MSLSRRDFLRTGTLAVTPFLLNWDLRGAPAGDRKTLRIGLCADPHLDMMHDAEARLRVFVDEMKKTKPDFILQLGDFCRPYEKNRKYVRMWDEFEGPRYHVIGNHDTDGGFKWPAVMKFWGMEKEYYSFDQGGWHFVVLNGNERNPKGAKGYPRHIGETQRAWLAADLKATKLPTILFCHQSLESIDGGIDNNEDVRALLEGANKDAGWQKVGLCLNGHHHIDFQRTIAGITYVQINSMSYYWMEGVSKKKVRVSPEFDKQYPYLANMALYKDALYTTVTLGATGEVSIAGKSSEFLGGSPADLGFKFKPGHDTDAARVVAKISPRSIKVAVR